MPRNAPKQPNAGALTVWFHCTNLREYAYHRGGDLHDCDALLLIAVRHYHDLNLIHLAQRRIVRPWPGNDDGAFDYLAIRRRAA